MGTAGAPAAHPSLPARQLRVVPACRLEPLQRLVEARAGLDRTVRVDRAVRVALRLAGVGEVGGVRGARRRLLGGVSGVDLAVRGVGLWTGSVVVTGGFVSRKKDCFSI